MDHFGDLWTETQEELLGDSVEITEGYRSWWSYVPHFIASPGYVYAYAFGQLLALSVYRLYTERGEEIVPAYLEMLSAGGSRSPESSARSSASTSPTRVSGTRAWSWSRSRSMPPWRPPRPFSVDPPESAVYRGNGVELVGRRR